MQCPINKKTFISFETMDKDQAITVAKDVVNWFKVWKGTNVSSNYSNEKNYLADLNDLIKHATGYNNLQELQQKGNRKTWERFNEQLEIYVEDTYRATTNPAALFAEKRFNDITMSQFRMLHARRNTDEKLLKVTRPFGLELFTDKQRHYQMSPRIAKAYFLMNKLRTFLDNVGKHELGPSAIKAIDDATGGEKIYYTLIPKLDPSTGDEKTRRANLTAAIDEELDRKGVPHEEKRTIQRTMIERTIAGYKAFLSFNYGTTDYESADYKVKSYYDKASYLGYITTANDLIRQMLELREPNPITGEKLTNIEKQYIQRIESFTARKGWLPTQNDTDLERGMMKNLPGVAKYLFPREDKIKASDSIDLAIKQDILNKIYTLSTMSSYVFSNVMDDVLLSKEGQDLKNNNPGSYSLLSKTRDNIQKYLFNDKEFDPSAGARVVRNMATIAETGAAFMLMFSMNLPGGILDIISKFGLGNTLRLTSDYKKGQKAGEGSNEKIAADLVKRHVDLFLRSFQKTSSFMPDEEAVKLSGKDIQTKFVNATAVARNKMAGLADAATSYGPLVFLAPLVHVLSSKAISQFTGKVPEKFDDMFKNKIWSFKGSEEWLRGFAAPLLYKKVMLGIENMEAAGEFKGLSDDDRKTALHDKIFSFIDDNEQSVFYDMSLALGDFSEHNRPFWTWMYAKDADTVGKAITGHTLRMMYIFKQIVTNHLSLIAQGPIMGINYEFFKKINKAGLKGATANYLNKGSAAGFFTLLALSAWDVYAHLNKKNQGILGVARNVNAGQEALDIFKSAGGIGVKLATMTNGSVSKEDFEKELEFLVRLGGGPIIGQTLSEVVEAYRKSEPDEDGFHFLFDNVSKNITDGMGAAWDLLTTSMDQYEFYSTANKFRKILDNPIPLLNYSNDMLKFFLDAGVATTAKISDESPYAKAAPRKWYLDKVMGYMNMKYYYNESVYEQSMKDWEIENVLRAVGETPMEKETKERAYMRQRINKELIRYGKAYSLTPRIDITESLEK